jgi:hypothetical protein
MKQTKMTILVAVMAAVLGAEAVSAADAPAVQPATRESPLSWKTPDGLAFMVKADDPILARGAVMPELPAVVKPDPAFVTELLQAVDDSLKYLSEKNADNDTQYYEKGLWHYNA